MVAKADLARLIGELPASLANAVSAAMQAAMEDGMDTQEAVCVVIAVAADYGRRQYGDQYLQDLCGVMLARGDAPLPH